MEERTGRSGKPLKPKKVKVPGATYDVHDDEWAALAVAVTFMDSLPKISLPEYAKRNRLVDTDH